MTLLHNNVTNNNINNNNNHVNSSPGSFDGCGLSAGWAANLRPSQQTWAVSQLKTGSYHPHPPSPLLLLRSL